MRLYRITQAEAESVVAARDPLRMDRRGNPIFVGRGASGQRVEVIVALDQPDFVITVFGEKD